MGERTEFPEFTPGQFEAGTEAVLQALQAIHEALTSPGRTFFCAECESWRCTERPRR